MGSYSYSPAPHLQFPPSFTSTKHRTQFPIYSPTQSKNKSHHLKHTNPISATQNSPKGFGPKSIKTKKPKKTIKDFEEDDEEEDYDEDDIIPEIVTNRMMTRMGISVGIPLFVGLLFFPFFYYLKVVLKIDIPTWIPFIVSFVFFGTALLGVSYGIVSSSWDPMREGSVLGWNEAKKNWPVFWQSISGGGKKQN